MSRGWFGGSHREDKFEREEETSRFPALVKDEEAPTQQFDGVSDLGVMPQHGSLAQYAPTEQFSVVRASGPMPALRNSQPNPALRESGPQRRLPPPPPPKRRGIHRLPPELPPREPRMPDRQAAAMTSAIRYPAYRYGADREAYAATMRQVSRITGTSSPLEDPDAWGGYLLPAEPDGTGWNLEDLAVAEAEVARWRAEVIMQGRHHRHGRRHAA